jgi:predicted nucleotidyltransferase
MARGSPLSPTGHEAVDEALRQTIAAFEAAFPGRVRGYYMEGSYADGTGIATSDLDLTVVFRGAFHDEAERSRAERLGDERAARSALELDVEVADEARLAGGVKPTFKEGSRLVYGEDIRDRLALLPIDAWARDRMHAAYWLLVRALCPQTAPSRRPVGCPRGAPAGSRR